MLNFISTDTDHFIRISYTTVEELLNTKILDKLVSRFLLFSLWTKKMPQKQMVLLKPDLPQWEDRFLMMFFETALIFSCILHWQMYSNCVCVGTWMTPWAECSARNDMEMAICSVCLVGVLGFFVPNCAFDCHGQNFKGYQDEDSSVTWFLPMM